MNDFVTHGHVTVEWVAVIDRDPPGAPVIFWYSSDGCPSSVGLATYENGRIFDVWSPSPFPMGSVTHWAEYKRAVDGRLMLPPLGHPGGS